MEWRLATVEGEVVTIVVPVGLCEPGEYDFVDVEVEETGETVTILVTADEPECRVGVGVPPLEVRLEAPLGDRLLIDGSTGEPVPSPGGLDTESEG